MTPTTKNFPHALMLTTALLLLAAPVRPVHAAQDDEWTKVLKTLETLLARTEVRNEKQPVPEEIKKEEKPEQKVDEIEEKKVEETEKKSEQKESWKDYFKGYWPFGKKTDVEIEKKKLKIDAVTPEWIMATHPGILTVLDAEKRLYQIKVLGQAPDECSFHAVRNSFYLLKLFTGTRAEFKTTYDQMVDEKSNDRFVEIYGCFKTAGAFWLSPENRNDLNKAIQRGALPQGSTEFWDMIADFKYYNYARRTGKKPAQPDMQYQNSQLFGQILHNIEPQIDNDKLVVEGVVALDTFLLLTPTTFPFCIRLGVFTTEPHATALLVTKQNGVPSFIFADSLGSSFIEDARPAINMVVNFVEHRERHENAVIRYGYANTVRMGTFVASQVLDRMRDNLTSLVQALGTTALKNNPLFKNTYYPAFKKLWEEAKTKKVGKTENAEEKKALVSQVKKLLQDLDPSKE